MPCPGALLWDRLCATRGGPMQRLHRTAVERLMDGRPDATLEAALEVFEVFASGSLTDEVYILEDVGGKRIAIAPTALKERYRRGGAMASIVISHQMGAGGPEIGTAPPQRPGDRYVEQELPLGPGRPHRAARGEAAPPRGAKPTP